jgi:multidrug efflux pump subunit AcrB
MNLAKLALDNARITICATLLIVLIGVAAYLSYPSSEDPTIQIRSASVTANYPGMSPERVEELITKPIESAMREIAEIKDIVSTSKTGGVKVKLHLYDRITDLAPIFQRIRNKANDLKPDLPEGTSGPFVHDEEGLTAIATIALWADGFSMTEMRDVARDTRDLLYTLDGVRKIEIMGAQEERVYLEVAPNRLAQLGVSLKDVFGALAQQNIIKPGGAINADGRIVLLEPSGNITSIDAIRDVVFKFPTPIRSCDWGKSSRSAGNLSILRNR